MNTNMKWNLTTIRLDQSAENLTQTTAGLEQVAIDLSQTTTMHLNPMKIQKQQKRSSATPVPSLEHQVTDDALCLHLPKCGRRANRVRSIRAKLNRREFANPWMTVNGRCSLLGGRYLGERPGDSGCFVRVSRLSDLVVKFIVSFSPFSPQGFAMDNNRFCLVSRKL
jgi:hypothetical protein